MKNKSNYLLNILLAIGVTAVAFSSYAEDRPRRGPPTEAINACSGKTEGAACNFTGRSNEPVTGACHQVPQGSGVLACRPKPPQAAFDACNGKKAGDACTFTGRRNNMVNGVCHQGPEALLCAPKNHRQQPSVEPETGIGAEPGLEQPLQ